MTLLKVHDIQQELGFDFIGLVKKTINSGKSFKEQKESIYLQGQEMGFCNEQIEALLEEVLDK